MQTCDVSYLFKINLTSIHLLSDTILLRANVPAYDAVTHPRSPFLLHVRVTIIYYLYRTVNIYIPSVYRYRTFMRLCLRATLWNRKKIYEHIMRLDMSVISHCRTEGVTVRCNESVLVSFETQNIRLFIWLFVLCTFTNAQIYGSHLTSPSFSFSFNLCGGLV